MSSLFDSLPPEEAEFESQQFLEEGQEEHQFLQQENERLRNLCAELLCEDQVRQLIEPFADHSAKTDAELLVKYHQTLSDIDEIRVDLAALEARGEQESVVLKSELEEVEKQCEEAEISFELLRKAAIKLQVRAFGVYLTPEESEELEEQFASALAAHNEEKLEEIKSNEQLNLLNSKSENNEEFDRVKIIDYEEIKIENQNLAEKIEERSEELLKLRRKTVSTLEILAHVREKRHFVAQEVEQLSRERDELENEVSQLREKANNLKTERTKRKREADESRDMTGLSGNQLLLKDFEIKTKHVEELHMLMSSLKRQQMELEGQFEEYQKAIDKKNKGDEW